jgi:hypothetical protein
MNKFSSVLALFSLLLVSFSFVRDIKCAPLGEKTILKEIGFMNILQAILSDPDFLDMSYPEQYKILDDFYKHVDGYLKEEELIREPVKEINGDKDADNSFLHIPHQIKSVI